MERVGVINFLKLRASYGITGNNDFGNFTAISTLSKYNYIINGTQVQGQTIGTLGNPELSWERNKQLDRYRHRTVNKRLTFTYGYYHKVRMGCYS